MNEQVMQKGLPRGLDGASKPSLTSSLPYPSPYPSFGGQKNQNLGHLETRYIEKAIQDTGAVELRHLPSNATGWFNHVDLLIKRATELSRSGNVFISLNRPSERFVPNRMEGAAVKNTDISHFTRLFFDFDPVREGTCPSTDAELACAEAQARKIFDFLLKMGFPDPLVAMSGNGYHLLYRTHLLNTQEVTQQLKAIYYGLYHDFSTPEVDLDRSVRSAGQICSLYGFLKRKGIETAERKYRVSEIKSWPRQWNQVSQQLIDTLANVYARKNHAPDTTHTPRNYQITGKGDYSTLDIVGLFQAKGLYQYYVEDVMHAVQCPFEHKSGTHTRGEAVIYANQGEWPGFSCKHDSCADRRIIDIINHFEDVDQFCTSEFQPKGRA